jgi:hypothetical protein
LKTSSAQPLAGSSSENFHPYPFWVPRFWNGMCLGTWWRLISSHGFDVHPLRWPMAGSVTACAMINSALAAIQSLVYGRKIQETPIHESPLFILGHWRSGTTLLHELLSCDASYDSPTTFQCFVPHHCLVSRWLLTKIVRLPDRRPMDNVRLDWNSPQEDEFALCALGAVSPYLKLAFPNHRPRHLEFFDMRDVEPSELARWEQALLQFMRTVSVGKSKPLLLKSPGHTGRLKVLRRLFPKARYIHVVRSPYALIPSTMRLWRALESIQGLQLSTYDNLEDYVFESFDRLYRDFDYQASQLASDQFTTVRYEDLVRDMPGEMQRIYAELKLPGFDGALPGIQRYVESRAGYKVNEHQLPESLRRRIERECAGYMQRYGYAKSNAVDQAGGDDAPESMGRVGGASSASGSAPLK